VITYKPDPDAKPDRYAVIYVGHSDDLTTGEAVGVFACGPIPVYACKIEDDAIFVDIDQQLNDAPLPGPPAPGSLGAR
jgi:hypothetical protein